MSFGIPADSTSGSFQHQELETLSTDELAILARKTGHLHNMISDQLAIERGARKVEENQEQADYVVRLGEARIAAIDATSKQESAIRHAEMHSELQLALAETYATQAEFNAQFQMQKIRILQASTERRSTFEQNLNIDRHGFISSLRAKCCCKSIFTAITLLALAILTIGLLAQKKVRPFDSFSPITARNLIISGAIIAGISITSGLAASKIKQCTTQ